ncbi:YtxH domain-containing protein [Macrococcus carouselicus]|uniref:YtxH domain-containing protein n=1 Tax=Macrococcus carouselicus TaxID=69969 RepID=A0A9Q8CL10_9STAP|nr:YtxH domain-containing protein [Macrococcus carouselicus]TDM00750.1 YtxH domain-containing protein [Macrococcus carouselicus]
MNNKLIPGMLIGAAVGAAIAMLDKNTRYSVKNQVSSANELRKNPSEVKDKFSGIKDELMYWKDQIEEIRRNNPELEKALLETKDMLQNKK